VLHPLVEPGQYTSAAFAQVCDGFGIRRSMGRVTLEDFLALPLERQQALILHSLSAILIHPAGKGVRKFDPSLIEPVWR
jgi:hypothetical protein